MIGPGELIALAAVAIVFGICRLMGFGAQRRRNDRERW